DYELRKFPFDRQTLSFQIQPFLAKAEEIRFAEKPLPSSVSQEHNTELANWAMGDMTYKIRRLAASEFTPASEGADFEIHVTRRSGFYFWKVFLPLAMLALIPTLIFWVDPKEFDWMFRTPMIMILSMVAFQFTITRDLPKIEYTTYMDAVFLTSFVFCFV